MSDNVKEVGLRFNIDGGIEFQKTVQEIKNEMNLASAEFQKATSAMDKNRDALQILTEKQKLYQKQIDLQKQKINVLNTELEKLSENEEENAEAISKKKIELTKAETQLNKYQSSLDNVTDKLSEQTKENKKLEDNLKQLGNELSLVEAEYEKNVSALKDNATETEKLTAKQKTLESQIDIQERTVNALRKQLDLLTNSEEKNEDAISKKKIELTKAETQLNNYKKTIKTTTDELEKQHDVTDKLINNLKNVGDKSINVGKKLTTVSAGIVGVGTVATKNSMDLEGSVKKYISTTGTAVDETEKYKKILLDINSNNYGDGYEDIANSMATVKQQMGDLVNDSNIQSIVEDAYFLRDAFEFDINESIRASKMLMDQYGISSKESFELITQGAQKGLNKNGDMLDSINEYSVHFKQLGFDAEDMFNVFKYGADSGAFSVDKIGDAIKEMGIRMKDGSATDELKSMNLNAKNLEKAFGKGGEEAKDAFKKVLNGLKNIKDPIKQNTTGVAIFGTMWEDLRC